MMLLGLQPGVRIWLLLLLLGGVTQQLGSALSTANAQPARSAGSSEPDAGVRHKRARAVEDGEAPAQIPKGVAGFRIGMTRAAARKVCRRAGFTYWSGVGREGCSGTPEPVELTDAVVGLWYCKKRLCRIAVIGDRSLVAHARLLKALTEKYGRPFDPNAAQLDEFLRADAPPAATGAPLLMWSGDGKKPVSIYLELRDSATLLIYTTQEGAMQSMKDEREKRRRDKKRLQRNL